MIEDIILRKIDELEKKKYSKNLSEEEVKGIAQSEKDYRDMLEKLRRLENGNGQR